MTPHIQANKGDIASTILLPGDPLRAKFIAENYFSEPKQFNAVRGMLGYTGTYEGVPVSVMGSGMGMPSIGIYAHELITFYGVKHLIRVGSIGSIQAEVKINDMVMAMAASTDSQFANQYQLPGQWSAHPDFHLLERAVSLARTQNSSFHVGNIVSSDIFYSAKQDHWKPWATMGVLGIEMETYALYATAAFHKAKALAICTVSDSLITGEAMSAEERQTSFDAMIQLALGIAF